VLLHSAAPKADGGGVQNVVLGLARHLRTVGHEVVVAWPDGVDDGTEWRLELTADVGPGERPGIGTMLHAAGHAATLARRLAGWSPDVVNVHFPRGSSVYFAALSRLLRYKLVLSFHNSDLYDASPALRSALPRLIAAAHGVSAVSGDLAESLRDVRPATPVRVIPNGVDLPFWSEADGTRDPWHVVAAGRLMPMKGFDILLRAFADGAPDRATLTIAGEGGDRAGLQAQVRQLGLADRVAFVGRLDREELRTLYGRAGLFAMPSRREGMPLALIEAMAAGLPVVAASLSGVNAVVTAPCGETVAPEDTSALADALDRWIGAEDRLEAAGRAAAARASLFSERDCYANYASLFSEICHG
jgi:glycosyltransferase involved in cell wall biosynthesis